MFIPQEELDKLNDIPEDSNLFVDDTEDEEIEQEEVIEKNKEKVSSSAEEDVVADKARVPYSRFESVNERAIRAEERLRILEEQAQSKTVESKQVEVPQEWEELYGDSEAAQKAYEIQLRLSEQMMEKSSKIVLEKIQNSEKEQKEIVNKNLEEIENSLNEFQEKLGRKITDTEESAILDIQDEFTAKDENGKYITSLLSPEKAYEIYELRANKAKVAKTQAKNRALTATGASSEGDTSNSSANYTPGDWGSWRSHL